MYQQGTIDNEERRARLASFVLYLFPNIMQCYVSHYIYKQGLSNKYCNNKRNPPVLTPTELLLIKELPKVQNFTVQLCYKLISFEGLLPTPSYGWGKLPHFKALTIADDIERIRHKINAIIELHNDVFTEDYFVKFLYQLEQIIHRLQIATEDKSVNPVYKYLLVKQIDAAVVLAELKNVSVIDSDVQRIKLQDRERYSKLSAVITEFFPKLLRIMIPSNVTPLTLYNCCTMPGNKWDKSQQSQIQTLQYGQNYESLDASMLYQIFRRFNFVPAPTSGWGREPTNIDLTIGDDIERIRILRNKTAHRCDTCIDQTDVDDYFLQFREITHRIAVAYEHELTAIQKCSFDDKRQQELGNALQQLEDITDFQPTAEDNELRIVLLGRTGSGKSATGNSLLGRKHFLSKTSGSAVTENCKRGEYEWKGKNVVIVDTPGLFDTKTTNETVTKEIFKCIAMTSPGPHVMVLVLSVGRFRNEEEETVKHFINHFSENVFRRMIVIFTKKDALTIHNQSIDQYVETVPKSLKTLLSKCGNRFIPFYNDPSGHSETEQVHDFFEIIEKMLVENEGSCYTNEVLYKEADAIHQRRMISKIEAFEKQMKQVREPVQSRQIGECKIS